MSNLNTPPRCESCGSAIALDELEFAGVEWAARQSFDDWDCASDFVDELRNATFVSIHPSFAVGCLCPSCRQPFTYGQLGDAYSDPRDLEDLF